VPVSVQLTVALVEVILVAKRAVGTEQLGTGPQLTLATQPEETTEPSLLNWKVKQPLALVDVKGPGIVVPQKPPANPPAIFGAALVLEICGEAIEFPSKTYKVSKLASVLKELNETVTTSPAFVGQIVVMVFSLIP
jgi:hypothetical protein